jgi:hypothetical protein
MWFYLETVPCDGYCEAFGAMPRCRRGGDGLGVKRTLLRKFAAAVSESIWQAM